MPGKSLELFDCRELSTPTEIFRACQRHARWSLNQGKIRSAISVFSTQAPKIHNRQFFSYAGYPQNGDPAARQLTQLAMARGWRPQQQGQFELLPLLIGDDYFEWEPQDYLEIAIQHPEYDWSAFRWRWYALPAISDMVLEIGGIRYETAPFSGYYMLTEVATRDLADAHRYNLLPIIAQQLGIQNQPLWQDRATYELNRAVLHSYRQAGVSMVDHHTASSQFMRFRQLEEAAGRPVSAQWSWIIPPTASSSTEVFFTPMRDLKLCPNFHNPQNQRQAL